MTEPLHTVRFPGETDEYRGTRDELLVSAKVPIGRFREHARGRGTDFHPRLEYS
jgi:hypothetical protein